MTPDSMQPSDDSFPGFTLHQSCMHNAFTCHPRNYGANIGVLLLKEYLLAQQLRVQVPDSFNNVSYDCVLAFELRCRSCNESGSHAESKFPEAVAEDLCAVSLLFCFSMVSGNVSLRFLPVSFNQAVGATTPFLTAVFAYLMSKKRKLWVTHATLAPAVAGITVASRLPGHSSQHQGILRSSEGEKLNSMNLLMYMAPIAVLFLLPSTLLMKKNVTGENNISCKRRRENDLVLGNARGVVAVVVSILILEILCR
ncbi:hypothetical protein WN943_004132 [Citrus x changshan-huyou]